MEQIAPLLLTPRLESRVWGGHTLAKWLGLESPPSQLAEVWLVYEQNTIAAGPWAGQTLADVARECGPALVGTTSYERYGSQFPLLAKLLDAGDQLSVQVHPDDAYAHEREAATGFHGKTEAWHILQASPGAQVIHGFNQQTSRLAVEHAIREDHLPSLLRPITAQPGDTIFVPAGTVHAINAGVVLFEIQQTSDLTYRVYDYGRPRELHLERALDVLSYEQGGDAIIAPQTISEERTLLVQCPFFAMERWAISTRLETATNPASCEILTVIEGAVAVQSGDSSVPMKRGEAVVLPASLGAYTLEPDPTATILRCYVP